MRLVCEAVCEPKLTVIIIVIAIIDDDKGGRMTLHHFYQCHYHSHHYQHLHDHHHDHPGDGAFDLVFVFQINFALWHSQSSSKQIAWCGGNIITTKISNRFVLFRPIYSFDGVTQHHAPQHWPWKFNIVEFWWRYASSYAFHVNVEGINGSAALWQFTLMSKV